MTKVLACIDGSAYTASVCDHAAWFAGRMDAAITLLNVRESPDSGEAPPAEPAVLVQEATQRLSDHGVDEVIRLITDGLLVQQAQATAPDLVVMGKRGLSTTREQQRLGSCVDDMILSSGLSICLTSQYFLPPEKVLVLMDHDTDRTRALEFVMAHAGLGELQTDVLVIGVEAENSEPKLTWARNVLKSTKAQVHSIRADGLDAAVRRYMDAGSADLIVVSRAVLLGDNKVTLDDIGDQSLWSWRCPVLVC